MFANADANECKFTKADGMRNAAVEGLSVRNDVFILVQLGCNQGDKTMLMVGVKP